MHSKISSQKEIINDRNEEIINNRNKDIHEIKYRNQHVLYIYALRELNYSKYKKTILLKIGYSADIIRRRKTLKSEYKCKKMDLIGLKRIKNEQDEKEFHKLLKDKYNDLVINDIKMKGKSKVELYKFSENILTEFDAFPEESDSSTVIINITNNNTTNNNTTNNNTTNNNTINNITNNLTNKIINRTNSTAKIPKKIFITQFDDYKDKTYQKFLESDQSQLLSNKENYLMNQGDIILFYCLRKGFFGSCEYVLGPIENKNTNVYDNDKYSDYKYTIRNVKLCEAKEIACLKFNRKQLARFNFTYFVKKEGYIPLKNDDFERIQKYIPELF